MCELCEKVNITKTGFVFDLDVAKGIYDNHKTIRYVVCGQNNFVYGLYITIKDAEEVALKRKPYVDLKIVDLENYKGVY